MIQTLPGFRDFYPADCAARNYVFARWREVARRYGFAEVDGPVLESVELYKKKSGDELVGQLFDFTDKGKREVALRPEMTLTVARMVAARDREFKKPLKWFSIASFFRHEKPQKGRLREFVQLNCDLIGEASPAADAEVIALAIDLMRACGLTADDFFVRVNDRNVWLDFLKARGVAATERVADFLQIIDKIERERPEITAQKLADFGVTCEEIDTFLDKPASELGGALGAVEADLRARGLADYVTFDPRIVRGLAYYTGVVFEMFDRGRKSRALAGGGRYDELIGLVSDGAVKHPALGFAVGDVTLLDLLRELPHTAALLDAAVRDASAPEVYVVVADEAFRPQALGLVGELRAAGRRVDFALTAAKVGKQFQAAEATGARYAAVVGNEWPQVKLKTLATREETAVDAGELAGRLGGLSSG